jgi:transcriptional regulator with GAF, ATPase, and Fis domain
MSTTTENKQTQFLDGENGSNQGPSAPSIADFALGSLGVRYKQELHDLIHQNVRNLVDFDSMTINLVDESTWMHVTYFYYSREAKSIDKEFTRIRNAAFPVHDGFFNVTMQNDFPVIWDLAEVSKWEKVPDHVQYCHSNGVSTVVGVSITDGERRIGIVFWGYDRPRTFSPTEIEKLQQLGGHIGFAVSNISGLEESLKKLKESEALLNLSKTLFSARNKTSLISAINSGLKALISFNGIMIILNESLQSALDPYVLYFDNIRPEHDAGGPLDPRRQQSDLKILKNVFAANEASTWLMKDLMKFLPRPDFIARHRGNNIRKVMGIPLSDNGEIMAALFLFSDKTDAFGGDELRILNDLAPQLGKTIANVVYLREIAKKEKEREIVMSMTRELVAVRDGDELERGLRKVFEQTEFFSEGFIYFYPPANMDRTILMFKQTNEKVLQEKGLPETGQAGDSDQFLQSLRQLKELAVVDIETYFKTGNIPSYVSRWSEQRARSFVAAPIGNGSMILGLVFFLSPEPVPSLNVNIDVFKSIVTQMSAVVNHVISNVHLRKQLNEINDFKGQLEIQNLYLQEEIQTTHNYSEIVGASSKMREVFHMVSQVAKTNSSVLILGETGTGKELIARAIHNTSLRKGKVMVKVNCGTLPANLIESELFGHERGSFTGATERRIGKFEMANNSTIFLDEIGELPLPLQVKLLRALQEKEIERIGGKTTIKVDVRVVSASNRDLLKEVQQGNFRGDLYFRLNVFPIVLPPLRERKEDIPLLANHFAEKYAKKLTISNVHFTSRVMKLMVAYNWPGNVRELEHLVERSVLLSKGRTVSQVYLPGIGEEGEDLPLGNAEVKTIDEVEREHIIAVLKMVNGKVSGVGGAAEMLKIPATTLASKIIKLKIKKGIS